MFHRAIGLRHSSTFATFSVDSEGAIGKIALKGPQAREFDVISTGELKKTDLNAVQLKYLLQHKLAAVAGFEFRWKCADFHSLPDNCPTGKIYAPS
ncbi:MULTISPECIES: hypothetical protein [unclassified Microcoleus]|uniref:hypothetical protein n=1 Tax=unclassified Microcoleus TaxID=2642155 RepID=UPI0025F92194|nr:MULTISPECIES: hypothetical protein [unclassified Microcoleus]